MLSFKARYEDEYVEWFDSFSVSDALFYAFDMEDSHGRLLCLNQLGADDSFIRKIF